MDGLGEGFLVLDNDEQTVGVGVGIFDGILLWSVEGVIVGSDVGASVGADDGETVVSLVGLRVGDTLIDDDLILFDSFNCSNNLAWVWSLDRSFAIYMMKL